MSKSNVVIILYRKLPVSFRNTIYHLFLGGILNFIRMPRNPIWYWKGYINTKHIKTLMPLFKNKEGLEIGGGTYLFSSEGKYPIYSYAKNVDGCNFSNQTIWEGNIESDNYLYNGCLLGHQYIGEASEICNFINKKYDFVISSNCLEHIANPMKAIESWISVLDRGGILFLLLPNKISNFDYLRPYTTIEHIKEDYNNDVAEHDSTHFNEILEFYNDTKCKYFGQPKFAEFKERTLNNYKNRACHHHVYSEKLLIELYNYFNLKILYEGRDWKNIFIVGQKI